MDDFGTGYSSLSYLWRFPFDKIKIDRSFMQGFDGSGRDARTVVKTIIGLGHELDMRVTVEGVETAEQAAFLDESNADQVQGFLFGRPGPASAVAAALILDAQRSQRQHCDGPADVILLQPGSMKPGPIKPSLCNPLTKTA
jgi:EAL domain-containing protein (putative c-di-GMP-specific phosphodiesterase class I)